MLDNICEFKLLRFNLVMLDNICEFKLVGTSVKAFFLPGISLKASLHSIFMHKVVVTEKKDMYREIGTSFIKAKERYSVQ